ncbi:CBL-interacting serine/threonine-protein kinase 5-like [Dioscorea cayenensis subsp. rotundata]|uniref:non-specific serine/threonine protein kinase n=1 Tax=Dioscorea cayennensis subsp. rotundata TaxID=55577 RepID=A0AB40ANT3_DIOCR|nr:CBL-interacting serine/threonine-protein kinase 5-like [Dioscorea cayenensis subsp. rotundata]
MGELQENTTTSSSCSDTNSSDQEATARKLILSRYELGRLLGKGTFAKVYHGRDLTTGESVAIKILSKDQVLREPSMADQIQREISIMRLVRHPNVVELKEVLATRSRIFFVLELARAGELFARVSQGRLPEPEARRYFRQLLSAVDFCHSRGVSHRDLKPENLLLDHNGDLKVSDFGLSALPEQLRHDGLLHTQCGTPAYVAPEVLRRRGYDGAKADLWSCGVILYVLLAGFLPFQDENLMKMYAKVFRADYQIPPWFSPEARRLVSRLLVADPVKRISIQGIMEMPWFRKPFIPRALSLSPVEVGTGAGGGEESVGSPRFYNAFELIASMSGGWDLSGLFEKKRKSGTVFTSRLPAAEILERLEEVGRGLGFGVEKGKGGYGVRMEGREERRGRLEVVAEVFEAAPEVAVVEFFKISGDALDFAKFCEDDVRPGLKDIVWTWQGDDGGDPATAHRPVMGL